MLTIKQQIERDRVFARFLKDDSSSESFSDSDFEDDLSLKEIWIKDRRPKRARITYNTVFEKRPTVLVKEAKDEEAEEAEAEEAEEFEAEEAEAEESEESEEAQAENDEAEAKAEESEEAEAENDEEEDAEKEDAEVEVEDAKEEDAEELSRLRKRRHFAQKALQEEMFFFQNMDTPPSSPFR